MPFFVSRLPDLVIPTGEDVSNILKAREAYEDAEYLVIFGEAVTDSGGMTYTFELCPNIDEDSPVWFTAQNSPPLPVDIAPPAQGKAFPLSRAGVAAAGADAIRIKASGAVTGAKKWRLTKQWRVD